MPKNAPTTAQMWSFHMLGRVCSNTLQARCQQYVNQEPPDAQAGFEEAEEPEIKLPTFVGT